MDAAPAADSSSQPRWKPVPSIHRRILGVLVEKAKTVPESYPMTLAGICTACNQKNNRYPLMQLEQEQLDEPLEQLRALGAISLVQGSGRVEKYRHYLREWLGVEATELAVMTELLLRGAQTEGELRQRASRLEPIADLTTLRNLLRSLTSKNLVLSLTSAGRGHVVTHNLYEPRELEKVKREYGEAVVGGHISPESDDSADDESATPTKPGRAPSPEAEGLRDLVASLQQDLDALRASVELLKNDVAALRKPE
jgi:uncharacterized protein YceH (UPF0502 family)